MSNKGGKGYSSAKDASEESTARSKVKVDTPAAKGGKGDKVANGAKKSTDKAATPPEPRIQQEIPPNSRCLMDCEAAEILQGIQDRMALLSRDADIKIPVAFDMGLAYAKRAENYVKPQTVRDILEPLKKYGVADVEVVLIANTSPETVDEAFNLVPSLKSKESKIREPLRIALAELANMKQALANLKKPE